MSEEWITIPGWERFQHYGLKNPTWIKNYISLLHKDEYLDLSLAARGMLHGIWLAYADWEGRFRKDRLRDVLRTRGRLDTDLKHLASLSHAGLIDYQEVKPLSLSLERSRARARARPAKGKGEERARNWIENGSSAEVPANHLAEVLADEFKIDDLEIIDRLVAQAQEFNA